MVVEVVYKKLKTVQGIHYNPIIILHVDTLMKFVHVFFFFFLLNH